MHASGGVGELRLRADPPEPLAWLSGGDVTDCCYVLRKCGVADELYARFSCRDLNDKRLFRGSATGAIPDDAQFWDDLVANSSAWGLAVYEQDWLHNEWERLDATLTSATNRSGGAEVSHGGSHRPSSRRCTTWAAPVALVARRPTRRG